MSADAFNNLTRKKLDIPLLELPVLLQSVDGSERECAHWKTFFTNMKIIQRALPDRVFCVQDFDK